MTQGNGLVALVVEDHDFQRRTTARMLRSLGVSEVLEAADGKLALNLIRDTARIDLVVCDLDMPEMDGMEFLRHLGQSRSDISVVISSAQDRSLLASVEKMARAYRVQFLAAIKKPITLDGLKDLIGQLRTAKRLPVDGDESYPEFSLEQILAGLRQNEFEPWFQPKIDLASGLIVGAEALARWRHPPNEIVGPSAFIAPLEQSGHIDELMMAVLKGAASACCDWRKRGWEYTVSVNLSTASLSETAQADRMTQMVRANGLDPSHMMLEVTETVAMTDIAPALENLTRLRMRGFGLSIDDYGTGFSSMQQLTRIPFTELKIDQSFVRGWSTNAAARAVVESSIAIGRSLFLKIVAEGVETRADMEALKAIGCDIAQGFYIASPMDGAAFIEFCNNYSAR